MSNEISDKLKEARDEAVREHCGRPKEQTMPAGLARNVIGVGIGPKVKRDGSRGELCIQHYVLRKIEPVALIPEKYLIQPRTSNGVLTDVIQTGRFVSFQGEAKRAAPGSTIGIDYVAPNVDSNISSTLSAFVKFGGEYYALLSNHAITVNGRVPPGTRILLRPPGEFIDDPNKYIFASTDAFVRLSQRYTNQVDCALAKVDKKDYERIETQFPDRIVQWGEPIDPEPGMKVRRVDEDPGDRAPGEIVGVNVKTPIDYPFGAFDFDDLVMIKGDDGPFANPGDSGGLLVDQASGKATALVIAGGRDYTVACPLKTCFLELERALAEGKGGENSSELIEAQVPKIELVVDPLPKAAPTAA
jgi:hypothetical protein